MCCKLISDHPHKARVSVEETKTSKPGLSSIKPALKTKPVQKKSGLPPKARVQTVEIEDEDDDIKLLDDYDDDARSTVQKPQAKKTSTDKATTREGAKQRLSPSERHLP